jgi:hypothetical protein
MRGLKIVFSLCFLFIISNFAVDLDNRRYDGTGTYRSL